jgi:O-antigen ligase
MKRTIFVLCISLLGIAYAFVDAYYGLLLYTWYAFASPLELTYGTLAGSRLSLTIAAIVIATTFQQKKQVVAHHILSLLMGLFLFGAFLSLAFSMQFSFSYIVGELELLFKLLFMAALAPVLINSIERLRYFIVAIALSVGILGFYYGVFGLLAGSTSISGPGRVGDNNGYAALLVGNLPLLALSLPHIPLLASKFQKIFVTLALVSGNILASILTFSRGGFLALSVVLILLLLNVKMLWTRILTWLIILPFLALLCWNIFAINPEIIPLSVDSNQSQSTASKTLEDYKSRLQTLSYGAEGLSSASSRLHFWSTAIEMTKSRPIFGVGFRRYPKEYNTYDTSEGKFGRFRAVHNTVLSVLSEMGLFGFSIFIGIFIFSIRSQSFVKKNAHLFEDPLEKLEILDYVRMTRISMLGFLIASFFVNCLFQELLWALISISIALEIVTRLKIEEKRL